MDSTIAGSMNAHSSLTIS